MDVSTQKFLILGVSKSGYSATQYILERGGECYLYEELKGEKIDNALKTLTEKGAIYVEQQEVEKVITKIDVLVISPGVPINHKVAILAKQLGKRIVGEFEFGFSEFTPTTIAVTGTNGKTTTVTLIDAILNEGERRSKLVGNVGVPISRVLPSTTKEELLVAEVSSFQLESINAFCPHISCVINIAPDHLERHYTMENYLFLKKRIFKNQRESEYTILNYDDQTVKTFYTEVKSKVVWISLKEKVDGGYREDGKLYFCGEFIIEEEKLKLKGDHNVYDTLFAIACAKIMKIPNDKIVSALCDFKGIRHRMQLVCCKNGVNYFNDSKATNTASTISAINCIEGEVVLILGGSEKGEDYLELFKKIKERGVKHVVVTGASRYKMMDDAGKVGYYDLTITSDFECAVKIASMYANEGDSVLLSPACASFDCFSSYEERGDTFIKLVEEMG